VIPVAGINVKDNNPNSRKKIKPENRSSRVIGWCTIQLNTDNPIKTHMS
jgi:hypothetical protein